MMHLWKRKEGIFIEIVNGGCAQHIPSYLSANLQQVQLPPMSLRSGRGAGDRGPLGSVRDRARDVWPSSYAGGQNLRITQSIRSLTRPKDGMLPNS